LETISILNTKVQDVGKYLLHKLQDSRSKVFFAIYCYNNLGKDTPGPGIYSAKSVVINGKGNYFLSSLRSSLGKSFGNSKRVPISGTNRNPGPGTYVFHSDFPRWRPPVKTRRISKT
jgi:hypothetical protein